MLSFKEFMGESSKTDYDMVLELWNQFILWNLEASQEDEPSDEVAKDIKDIKSGKFKGYSDWLEPLMSNIDIVTKSIIKTHK